jgi:hypothetical protein
MHRYGIQRSIPDRITPPAAELIYHPFMRVNAAVAIIALAGSLACAAPEAATTGQSTIAAIATPAGANSGQPYLSLSKRGILLSWIERDGARATLKFAERTPSGWTEPRIVSSGENWFVNWADVPSVIRLTDGSLKAHWLQKSGPDTYAYDVRLASSTDDGRTWTTSVTPHHDGTQTEHGFASLFEMRDGGLGLVWLDGRSKDAMSIRFGTFDRNGKQTAETPVDLRVCDCCPTTAALTSEGPIVAFRDRSDEEIRDISVSRLENGTWTPPRTVHADGWKIPACPVNGPVLSARGRDVALAWFTVVADQGRAFVAFSKDAGRTFGAPIRLDDAGSLGRVDVELLDDGSAVASWIEFADQRAQFRSRRVEPSGARGTFTTIAGLEGTRASGYPRIARHAEELVFAWTESRDGQLRVQTAVARGTMYTDR